MNMTSSSISSGMGQGGARATVAAGSSTIPPTAAAAAAAAEDNHSEANSTMASYSSTATRDYSLPSSFAGDDEGIRSSGEVCTEHKLSMTSLISSSNQSQTSRKQQQQQQQQQQREDMSQLNDDSPNEAIISDRGGETTEEVEESDDADSKDQLAVKISKETQPMMHLLRLLKEMEDGKGNYYAGSTDVKGKALASLIHDFEDEISMIEHRVKDEYLIMNGEQPQDPMPLPPNWIELVDSGSGDVYYANEATGQTQWERPVASKEGGETMPQNDRRNNVHQQGYFDSSQHSDMNNSHASNIQSSNRNSGDQRIESSHQSDINNSRTRDMQNSHLSNNFQSEGNQQSYLNMSNKTIANDQNANANDFHSMRNSSTSNNFNSSKGSNIFDGNSSATMQNSFKSNMHELGTSKTNLEDRLQESSVTNSKRTSPIDDLPPEWTALVDPDSGDTYYANEQTGETTWDKPEHEPSNNPSHGSDDHLPAEWIALEDAQSGDTYYLNQVTMATTWDRPTATNQSKPSSTNNADPTTDQLPPGWEAIYDPSCGEYFYAHESGETQWEIPEPDHVDGDEVQSDPQAPDDGDDNNLPSGWFAAVDEGSGETYYCNEMTCETTWDIPTEAAATHDTNELHPPDEDDDLPPDWYAVTDQASGDTYYCNEVTGETTWDRPSFSKDGKIANELSMMSRLSMNDHTATVQHRHNTEVSPYLLFGSEIIVVDFFRFLKLLNLMESPMMPNGTSVERVRIVSVGDVGVGKSCLIKKYCEPDKFVNTHLPTIGVDYGSKKSASVARNDGKLLDIDFFDLSGDPDYFEVRNEFYKYIVNGIIFVFDVTNEKSFESLAMWLDEAEKYGISSETIKVMIGNKIDLYPREVTEQQGKLFASRCGATYFETSAKTGASVDDVFQFILDKSCK